MGGVVGPENAKFSYHEAWVVLACHGSCKAGAVYLELFENCDLVLAPGLFSVIHCSLQYIRDDPHECSERAYEVVEASQ